MKTKGFNCFLLILLLSIITCDNGDKADILPCANGHNYNDWTATTCTTAGNKDRICTRPGCGNVEERISGFEILGHEGLIAATAATCTTTGNTGGGTCTRSGCGYTITNAMVPALGHEGLTAATPATCTAAGNTGGGICTRSGCGYTITNAIIPALGHEGLAAATPATCTTAGNTVANGTCTRSGCGQIFSGTVIAALGHDHISSLICKRASCDHQYAIGDTGPAGGIIFYVVPSGFPVLRLRKNWLKIIMF